MAKDRLIVAIADAAGAAYGLRALAALKRIGKIETHAIVSRSVAASAGLGDVALRDLADAVHDPDESGSPDIVRASTLGLLVAPCPAEALRRVAEAEGADLLGTVARRCLDAGRRVALLVTETPVTAEAIRLMAAASRRGAVIVPPVPAFYHRPKTLDEIIDQTVGRTLDLFGLEAGLVRRWTEDPGTPS